MNKEGILRHNYEPFSLQQHVFHTTKIHNRRREFTSMWMLGALLLSVVYQHSPWQAILQRGSGFLRDCLRAGRVPRLAGLPTPCVKEVFILFFSKHIAFFMPDKCILKLKIHPMTSSLFHGIYRILQPYPEVLQGQWWYIDLKLCWNGFLARLYSFVNDKL